MIVITMEPKEVHIRGHSGYADAGKDIVCAAVSTLLQTIVKSILDLTNDEISYELSPGNGSIEFKDLSEQGKLLMDSFFIGICMIVEEYPAYVRIE